MITIFSCPKPFTGNTALLQRNAVLSWTQISPRPEIILLGSEQGVAEVCGELGFRQIPEIACNEAGIPLVSDLFAKAEAASSHEWMCFINTDIIVTSKLTAAMKLALERWKSFVLCCSPWNSSSTDGVSVGSPGWESRLDDLVRKAGRPPKLQGIDLLLFPKGSYRQMPPFLIGRMAYDNWFIFKVLAMGIPLIDASRFVFTVHQDHPGSSHSNRHQFDRDTRRNQAMAGWWPRTYIAQDAPYRIDEDGCLTKRPLRELLGRRLRVIMEEAPLLVSVRKAVRALLIALHLWPDRKPA